MRVLTLLGGPRAVDDGAGLSREIRSFNAGVDFRLRFLDIGIEEVVLCDAEEAGARRRELQGSDLRILEPAPPLVLAAAIALRLSQERPDLLVVVGGGERTEPAVAAATAAGVRLAVYGRERPSIEGALDLGAEPAPAVERVSGVAREIA
ncbi:MAG: hypothetical protein ACE5JG_03220 [Planctomycetota bacterium]